MPPQAAGKDFTVSLVRSCSNLDWERGLVRTSATCSKLATCYMWIALDITISQTKYKSISMCFVRACKTAFFVKEIVLKLSYLSKGFTIGIHSSKNGDLNQYNSTTQLETLRYSAFVDDHETVCCFLVTHETRLGPKNMQKPVVDFLSSRQDAQSASL